MYIYIKNNRYKKYLTHILKSDTSSGDMNEKLGHWLDSFEKFYKKYIITPIESYNYSFPEESRYIAVRPTPGFINQENEARYYFNETIQLLYSNIIFRQLIPNIDFYTIMNSLD